MHRMVLAAKARGVERFHVDILNDNLPMLNLMDDVGVNLLPAREQGVLTLDLPLPDAVPADPPHKSRPWTVERVLHLAAKRALRVLPRWTRGQF